jgi:IS1 family transposase
LIVAALDQGSRFHAIRRILGAWPKTAANAPAISAKACADYQDRTLRNLPCKRVQLDEIWNFVYAKEANLATATAAPDDAGDIWTWTAICADTKLLVTFLVGGRDTNYAIAFVDDLKERLANRVQITSDGHGAYLRAVDQVFGDDVDYGMLVKIYGADKSAARRYSPAKCLGVRRGAITGNPDPKHISTSYAERQNLTMRMLMRRFNRLTNEFSKKVENHACALALHAMYYNFVRIHQTLKVTPAMAAGLTDRLWEMKDLVEMPDLTIIAPCHKWPLIQ